MSSGDVFPVLTNDLVIKSALGFPVKRVPIWIMRQAGRYLPEFRKLREQNDFFKICQTPELACEITLQPILRFNLDAAIIFSDILVIPQAVGQTVEMQPGKGPVIPNPVRTIEDLKALNWDIDVAVGLKYVMDALTLTRHKLNGRCPLIGFAGAPWTLMAYMIEGESSTTFAKAKKWLYSNEEESQYFLEKLTNVVSKFLLEQIKSGAQMLQIFDSHAGILSPKQFSKYSLPYLRKISNYLSVEMSKLNFDNRVPIIIFAKGAHFAIEDLANSGFDVVSLDWTVKPSNARRIVGNKVCLQGNLDPCALYSSNDNIVNEARNMLESFGCQRYIANLGHGIYPDMDPEKVKVLISAVQKISEEIIDCE